jgi:hypothetical protein
VTGATTDIHKVVQDIVLNNAFLRIKKDLPKIYFKRVGKKEKAIIEIIRANPGDE